MDTSILVYRPKGITLQARVGHYRLVLGLALGPQGFLDTNMLLSGCTWGQREDQKRQSSRSGGIWAFK